MPLPGTDVTSITHGDLPTGDLFTKCARRITNLLCGSADVNGGKTMADWERFLRASKSSFLSGSNNFQQCIADTQERLLHHQQGSENITSPRNLEPILTTEEMFPHRTLEQILHDSALDSCSVQSTASSHINNFPTSTDSCCSLNMNNCSDDAVSVDSDESAGEVRTAQSLYDVSELQANESTESVESSSISVNSHSGHKRFMNLFRNPWIAESSRRAPIPILRMGAQRISSEEISDNDDKEASFFMIQPLRFSGPSLQCNSNFYEIASDLDDIEQSERRTTDDDIEDQTINANQNSSANLTGGFSEYGRGSPDGLSSCLSVSNQSLIADNIAIIDDNDPEMQGVLDSSECEEMVLHPEETEDFRLSSMLSTTSIAYVSPSPSWESASDDEEEATPRDIEAQQENVLGMLPAGYHQSDDTLFVQLQDLRERLVNNLSDVESEQQSEWMQAHHPIPHPLPEAEYVPAGSSPYLRTTTSAINALECPVCITYMCAPIWLCVNGHNVCGRCQQRVFSCPVCRGRLLYTRNLALEAIATDLAFHTGNEAQETATQNNSNERVTMEKGDNQPNTGLQSGESSDSPIISSICDAENLLVNEQEVVNGDCTVTNREINSAFDVTDDLAEADDLYHELSLAMDSPQPKGQGSI